MKKICSKCKKKLVISKFYLRVKRNKKVLIASCKKCQNRILREWRKNNPEKLKAQQARYKKKHPKIIKGIQEKYRNTNRIRVRENQAKYRTLNIEKVRKSARRYVRNNPEKHRLYQLYKMKNDSRYRLRQNISSLIYMYLKRRLSGKQGGSALKYLPYSIDELMEHLQKKFRKGMTWKNYGLWHIDHILPDSIFDYNLPTDIGFKKSWRLKNLQPLWGRDNLIKRNKVIR